MATSQPNNRSYSTAIDEIIIMIMPSIRILGLLLSLVSVFCEARTFGYPSIILVMADDQGIGDMGYTGHPFIKTPNFDQASKEGIRFTQFYSAAPVCSPTRASVLTGRHPNRMGVFKWGYPMRPQEITLAEMLQAKGYRTAHFGKWHLGSVRNNSPADPGNNGFDHWVSAPNFYDNDPVLSHGGKAMQHEGESSEIAVALALKWIESLPNSSSPFFAVIWFGSPHSPHRAIGADRALYKDHPPHLQQFFGEVTGMDRAFGTLRNRLEALGIRDKTILWYCSDNGALPKVGSTSGYRGNKGKVYEGGLRVPSFVEWPARYPTPRAMNIRSQTSDIFPTLLEWAGIKDTPKHPLDGISLVPLIENRSKSVFRTKKPKQRSMGFWDYTSPGIRTPSAEWMGALIKAQQAGGDLFPHVSSQNAAMLPNPPYPQSSYPGHSAWIEGDWKLHRIQNKQGTIRWELYDLKTDPVESKNLLQPADQMTHAPLVRRMQSDLHGWLASVVDSLNGKDYAP